MLVPLLSNIHDCNSKLGSVPNSFRLPYVYFRESSWDFQLPDIVRPLATTTVGTIAIIARRMGMKWKNFRPVDGVMRAEGCGQIITATTVRSLGTAIQYVNTGWSTPGKLQEMYIPDDAVDALGFGLICNSWSNEWGDLPAWAIGTHQQVLATLRKLEPTGDCSTVLQNL